MDTPPYAVPVLNAGFVGIYQVQADDLSVVNSARVSFGKRREEMGEADAGLIRFLMKNRHGTPFEHNLFTFHVRCPIFVAREWVRHRIGSFNEFSARYTEMPPDWYVPDHIRQQKGKPGAYVFEEVRDEWAANWIHAFDRQCQMAFELYEHALADGVAKEQARCVLPVGMYTEFYWTVNARSLMNFLNLRTAPNALKEIREFAEVIEGMFCYEMPLTYQAWIDNNRVAP